MARIWRYEPDFAFKSLAIHHLGIHVKSLFKAVTVLQTYGFVVEGWKQIEEEHLCFLRKDDKVLEIIEGGEAAEWYHVSVAMPLDDRLIEEHLYRKGYRRDIQTYDINGVGTSNFYTHPLCFSVELVLTG
ncbi:hypothetical protein [Aureibacillus halotolerans]|uniref:Glyoxalase/bleomycin resistance protein/dioxygenase superfamily protein n=1 Tax=Aureibacillus halotolerans TaxID=1508390 RepID=A0A4R6UHY1_9BACI|nr:hypothetical protein [Aureibacillus halotolerans]TDQ42774.1 hypothetical protein EV213_101203 [Aureibacillus halotolerans]